MRVVTSSGFNNAKVKPLGASVYLSTFLANHAATHHFFPDDIRIINTALYDLRYLQGHKQITDLHLMGLCQQKGVRSVTLDHALQSSWFALVNRQIDLIRFLLPPTAPPP